MRIFWVLLGVTAHVVLGMTVWYLFDFFRGGEPATSADSVGARFAPLVGDSLLALQFAVLHSLLLWRGVRDRLERFIPRLLYGCFFALMTCASLLLAISAWQPIPVVYWHLQGTPETIVSLGHLLGWVGLVYTMSLTGLGYQTGSTPFWAWLRRREPPRRRFEPRGVYHLLRHPVYLCVLVLVWVTPVLTLDRLVLGIWWTLYVFIGSYLKDRRLEFYLGERYRAYEAQVPGYPFIGFGPLGRRSNALAAQEAPV